MRERILITGPGGRIGPHLLPLLRPAHALRLFDLQPSAGAGDDEVAQGDVRDFAALKDACAGVSGVIHLAAISDEADFHTKLLPVNLLGEYNAFEAARQAGVAKFVFASTAQTVLNYGEGNWVSPEMPPRPITVYACTKLFGEALGRYYAERHGMQVTCIRIAWFQPYDSPLLRSRPEMGAHWCSPGDLAQLILASLAAQKSFAVFFGVSNNAGRFWDISNAQQLVGYDPKDDAAKHRQ